MEFKRYKNIEEFGKENLELLLEKEWLNNLIVGNYFEGLKKGAEYCVLFADDKNPISNHVYEKIGYKRMVDCEHLHFCV